jgi:hypothetical protein
VARRGLNSYPQISARGVFQRAAAGRIEHMFDTAAEPGAAAAAAAEQADAAAEAAAEAAVEAVAVVEAASAELADLPVGRLDGEGSLLMLAALGRLQARAEACTARALAHFNGLRSGQAREFAPEEVALGRVGPPHCCGGPP